MNHVVEVQYMEKMNRKPNIKKLNKDEYVDMSTGEIKEFKHIANRSESLNSLRQTFKKLRYLINNNFIGERNELFLTLTYRENMTDTEKLYDDFRKFIQRLRYKYRNNSSIDYISVVEPQERGAWHCHVLLRFNDLQNIFIHNQEMADLWGHGFVQVESLKDVDNIGAYLSAYLSDVELTDENMLEAIKNNLEVIEKEVDGQKKKFIKGGRLYLYPAGMNFFRKSGGIKYPDRKKMRFENVKKIVGSAQPHYSKSYKVENNDFKNTITFEQYNLKRL